MHQIEDHYGGTYDPNAWWPNSGGTPKFLDFEKDVMDDVWACPFNRGKGPGMVPTSDTIEIGSSTYQVSVFRGKHSSYHTWKWDGDIERRRVPFSSQGPNVYPTDPYPDLVLDPSGETLPAPRDVDGRPRYSVLSWNWGRPSAPHFNAHRSFFALDDASADLDNRHRTWTAAEARRVHSGSLSETTVVFCAQGEHMGLINSSGGTLYNPESHRTSAGGGTNVMFADTHVGWVKGRQVGWQ
jgi:prepilin-type processing-associated H-X9-DG protein